MSSFRQSPVPITRSHLSVVIAALALSASLVAQTVPIVRVTPPLGSDAGGEFASLAVADFNGDGIDDLAAGQPSKTSNGRVVIYSGINRVPLQTILPTPSSDIPDAFGRSVLAIEDLNGDLLKDLIVGVPGTPSTARVEAYSGATGQFLWSRPSPVPGLAFGWSLSLIDDINGDTFDDILVGSPRGSMVIPIFNPGPVPPVGQVAILSGIDGTILRTLQNSSNPVVSPAFGVDVVTVGDLDGDGVDDVIASAGILTTNMTFDVQAFSGATGAFLGILAQGTIFVGSATLARHRDLNGDGRDELLLSQKVSSSAGSGRLTCISSNGSGAIWSIVAAGLGEECTQIDDIDNDGVPDIASSVGLFPSINIIQVVSGANGGLLWNVPQPSIGASVGSQDFGHTIVKDRDRDGDGKGDLVAIGRSVPSGTHLLGVSAATGVIDFRFEGVDGTFGFGTSIIEVTDFDNDGRRDVLIGAPRFSSRSLRQCGAAFLVSTLSGSVLARFDGSSHGQQMGISMVELGDVNSDGVADFAFGSPYTILNAPTVNRGRIEVRSGSNLSVLWSTEGALAHHKLGISMARIPDRNGDGVADLAVSRHSLGPAPGNLFVHSGTDGTVLQSILLPGYAPRPSNSLLSAGDLDADGVSDLIVGTCAVSLSQAWNNSAPIVLDSDAIGGIVVAISGSTGAVLWTTFSPVALGAVASSLTMIADRNGDGVQDVLVGSGTLGTAPTAPSRLEILSGSNGTTLSVVSTGLPSETLGIRSCVVGDQDGDLVTDFVAVASQPQTQLSPPSLLPARNRLRVFSSATFNLVTALSSASYSSVFQSDGWGYALTATQDLDGDGLVDLAVGVPNALNPASFTRSGHVDVYSVRAATAVTPVGNGCAVSSNGNTYLPQIGTAGGPPAVQTGNPGFAVTLQGAPPAAVAALFYALPSPSWNGLPLPLDLTPFGVPGCVLQLAPTDFVSLSLLGSSPPGSGSINAPIPQNPSLSGVEILTQWVLQDPSSPTNPIGLTSALRIRLL